MSTFITILCIVAVMVLWGIDQRRHSRTETRLTQCEKDRQHLAGRVARLEAGCSLTACPLRDMTREDA